MKYLLHRIFGCDFLYLPGYGVRMLRVNQDGVMYVKFGEIPHRISVHEFKYSGAFFIYGTALDYFSPNEIEDIHGTTHSQ